MQDVPQYAPDYLSMKSLNSDLTSVAINTSLTQAYALIVLRQADIRVALDNLRSESMQFGQLQDDMRVYTQTYLDLIQSSIIQSMTTSGSTADFIDTMAQEIPNQLDQPDAEAMITDLFTAILDEVDNAQQSAQQSYNDVTSIVAKTRDVRDKSHAMMTALNKKLDGPDGQIAKTRKEISDLRTLISKDIDDISNKAVRETTKMVSLIIDTVSKITKLASGEKEDDKKEDDKDDDKKKDTDNNLDLSKALSDNLLAFKKEDQDSDKDGKKDPEKQPQDNIITFKIEGINAPPKTAEQNETSEGNENRLRRDNVKLGELYNNMAKLDVGLSVAGSIVDQMDSFTKNLTALQAATKKFAESWSDFQNRLNLYAEKLKNDDQVNKPEVIKKSFNHMARDRWQTMTETVDYIRKSFTGV
ncbi:HBL/NHE enterotoxin family protein [Magnetococcales bacterium HHB-1]